MSLSLEVSFTHDALTFRGMYFDDEHRRFETAEDFAVDKQTHRDIFVVWISESLKGKFRL